MIIIQTDVLHDIASHNGGTLNVGPPEKIIVTEHSKPPVLSPEKRQALQQDQAKTHHSPALPISDQAIKSLSQNYPTVYNYAHRTFQLSITCTLLNVLPSFEDLHYLYPYELEQGSLVVFLQQLQSMLYVI